jgi:hypothetical protein
MSLVHNERTKLTATWFNTLATALLAAGVIAPVAALLYGLADVRAERLIALAVVAVCGAGGLCLHVAGRVWLRRLRE